MIPEVFYAMLAGAGVNGLITYGVVKATLHFLHEGVREAKASATAAHRRIDDHLGHCPRHEC